MTLPMMPTMGVPVGTPSIVAPDAAGPIVPGLPAPPLPLKVIMGPEYPALEDPEGVKTAYLGRLKEGVEADNLAHYRMASRNLLYANGRQHITWNTRHKQYDEMPLEPNEVRATYNLIKPMLRSRSQRLLSPTVSFSATPQDMSYESKDRAAVAVNVLQARYRLTGIDDKLMMALWLAFCSGVAALKSYWNPDIGPLQPATFQVPEFMLDEAGNPVFDEQGMPIPTGQFTEAFVDRAGQLVETEQEAYHYRPGDTDTAVRTVFNLTLNPEAKGFTPGDGLRWLLDEEMVPISVLKARYPEYAEKMKASQQGLSSLTYERMASASALQRTSVTAQDRAFSPQATTRQTGREDLCLLREFWQLPDSDYFPNGRLMVQAGDCIVYDGPFPQGIFPYAGIYDEPAPLTWRGSASVNDMVNPQDLLNRQLTSVVREMDMVGNGQYVAWDLPGLPGQITAEHGAIIKVPMRSTVANKSIGDVFKRLDPPTGPSERWRLVEMVQQALYSVGSYHEVTRGQTPPGVDSGVAIKYLLEQEQGQLLRATRALKNSLVQWAKQQLAIAVWGYGEDEERWVPVDRPDMGFQIETVTGKELPDPETLIIDLENFKPTSEAERKGGIIEAMDKGWIDVGRGLSLLDLGQGLNPLLASNTRHYAKARAENLAIERGNVVEGAPVMGVDQMGQPVEMPGPLMHLDNTPLLLPQDDDPFIHMLVLDELILDNTKPWPVRQLAMRHKDEHRQAMAIYVPVLPSPLAPQAGAANTPAPAGPPAP